MSNVESVQREGGHRVRHVSIMVTRRCTMTCAHCSVESSPGVAHLGPDDQALLAMVEDAAAAGVTSINFTGGEPMIRDRLVLQLMREAHARGVRSVLTTNGYWGRKPERAEELLDALLSAGLARMTVSYDRYHAEFQGPEPAVNIVRAAAARQFTVNINITRMRGDRDLDAITAPFDGFPNVMLRFYDVQPLGFAATGLGDADWRGSVEGFCNACDSPAIMDDGRVTACNGPAYFTPPDHPLQLGSLAAAPLAELLRRHEQDPILDTIRTAGPAHLRTVLAALPEGADFPWRAEYRGMCDLCLHINGDRKAVAALRSALSQPSLVAEREARRVLIRAQRRRGRLEPAWVNGVGAARLLHRALRDPALVRRADWQDAVGHLFGRADLDWNRQVRRLIDAGLARPAQTLVRESVLSAWAPAFVADRIGEAAEREVARGALMSEALAALREFPHSAEAQGLALTPAGGVALAGAVPSLRTGHHVHLLARPLGETGRRRGRAVAQLAPALAWLKRVGFESATTEPGLPTPAGADLRWGALPVRVTLVPAWLVTAGAGGGSAGDRLPPAVELMLLLGRLAERDFAGGTATAWDVDCWLSAAMSADASLATTFPTLVQAGPAPRVPWVALAALDHAFGLPASAGDLLARAPADERQRRLVLIACHRVLLEGAVPATRLDLFSEFALGWLLRDGWMERGRWVQASLGRCSPQRVARLPADVRQALERFRGYRRTLNHG